MRESVGAERLLLVVGIPLTNLCLWKVIHSLPWHPPSQRSQTAVSLFGHMLYPFLVGWILSRLSREKPFVICCAVGITVELLIGFLFFQKLKYAYPRLPLYFLMSNSLPAVALLISGICMRLRLVRPPSEFRA
jgi:hypothetical protein